ncbi:tyrosine-type recombinase/integrase [Actinoallomurus sp. CA-150999]|uniref:tyrosine-type recombinase/integrase n=1 Tax=Actinoallomurus sp. CA-150999 TaxID=3239887 RepID=UPI003D8EBB10
MFATRTGGPLSAGNVRREFRRVVARTGLVGADWTPREMRRSFVSALSAHGVALEEISRLVGHQGGSAVAEKVYREEIRPAIQSCAVAMNRSSPSRAQKPSQAVSQTLPERVVMRRGKAGSERSEPATDQVKLWRAILGSNQ